MKIHTLFLFSVAMLLCVGVFGQDSVRISYSLQNKAQSDVIQKIAPIFQKLLRQIRANP